MFPPSILPVNAPTHALPDAFPEPLPELYRTLLFFGAPGSGKGTQGKALGAVPRFYHCACGDVFRTQPPVKVLLEILKTVTAI